MTRTSARPKRSARSPTSGGSRGPLFFLATGGDPKREKRRPTLAPGATSRARRFPRLCGHGAPLACRRPVGRVGRGREHEPAAGRLGEHGSRRRRDHGRREGARLRVNLFLYLNADWDDAWGGHLELWDRELTRCEQRIAPLRNRLVIFASTDFSFHGHPTPLTCPPDRTRRSLAVYYYKPGGIGGRAPSEVNLTARRAGLTTLYRDAALSAGVCAQPALAGT